MCNNYFVSFQQLIESRTPNHQLTPISSISSSLDQRISIISEASSNASRYSYDEGKFKSSTGWFFLYKINIF